MKEIAIKMPDEMYDWFVNGFPDKVDLDELQRLVINGTVLPESHGRLIDSDDMIEDLQRQCKEVFKLDAVKPEDYYIAKDAKFMQATWKEWCDSFCVWANNRKTIVEADGGAE